MQIDAGFFSHFDTLSREAASLDGIENSLEAARRALHGVRNAEAGAEHSHHANLAKQRERRERIELCENSWFFGNTFLQPQTWFKGGVEGKIQRQKEKLVREEADLPGLAAREQQLEQQVAQHEAQVAQLSSANARKQQLTQELNNLFEGAVRTAPTPQLQQLEAAAHGWQSNLALEQQNSAALQQVAGLCSAARQRYYSAMHTLQQAANMNRAAQFNNAVDGSEFVEHVQQDERDQLMQRAQFEANQGAQQLQQAFTMIPPTAHGRYPQLTAGLGTVTLPQLEQMGFGSAMLEAFGGDLGDAIAGQQANAKIHRNIQVLAQCEQIIAQQEALVRRLQQAVRQDGEAAAANLQQTNAQIAAEKSNVFNALRAAAGVAMPVAPVAAVAMPVYDDHYAADQAATVMQKAVRDRWAAGTSAVAAPIGETAVATAVPAGMPTAIASATAMPPVASAAAAVPSAEAVPTATAAAVPMATATATAIAQPVA